MKWNNELERELQNEMADEIKIILDNMRLDELVEIHNKYINKTFLGIEIYDIGSFNEMFCGIEPLHLLEITRGINITLSSWFWEDNGGCLCSDYDDELPVDASNIADYCVEKNEDFGCDEIKEYLNTKEDLKAQILEELEEQKKLYNTLVGI